MTTEFMRLLRVYEVPRRTDGEGRLWYQHLSDMHFATARVGWAVGTRQLLRSADGGRTWVNQFRNSETCSYLNPSRVFALSGNACWLTAILSTRNIRCCFTRDGGRTWKGKRFKPEIYPNDLFFTDSNRGWLVSGNGLLPAGEGRVHVSDDGGENWQTTETLIKGKPDRIRFYGARIGWLIEHYGNKDNTRTYSRLHLSVDSGYSWRKTARFDRPLFDLHALDDDRIFVVGETGFIAQSRDRGKNWKRIESRSRANLNAIQFYRDKIGLAVGDFNTLLLSKDGGQNWERIGTSYDSGNFISAHFTSNRDGVISSDRAIHSFELTV